MTANKNLYFGDHAGEETSGELPKGITVHYVIKRISPKFFKVNYKASLDDLEFMGHCGGGNFLEAQYLAKTKIMQHFLKKF